MHPVFRWVLAEYPRFRNAVLPEVGACRLSLADVTSAEHLRGCIAASELLFPMGDARWSGQVWWFSWNNSVVGPAVTAMVECYKTPSLALSSGVLHVQPGGYWHCYSTDIVAGEGAWRAAGAEYAKAISPLIDAVASVAGLKPAPLWAIAADALVLAAVEAGNQAFDPYRGVRVACELSAGLAEGAGGAHIPSPRFSDISGGEMRPTDMEAVRAGVEVDDVHTVARRASCCMVFRSPGMGKCLSCPRQNPDVRRAALIAYVQ